MICECFVEWCFECGSVYKMEYVGFQEDYYYDYGYGYGWKEFKIMVDYVKFEYW